MPVPPDPDRDFALVTRARAGESQAIEQLLDRMRCVPRFVSARNRKWGGRLKASEVEDLAVEILSLAWVALERYRGGGSLEAWLHRFVQFEMLYRMRQRDRDARVQAVEKIEGHASEEITLGLSEEELAIVSEALALLDPEDRELVRQKCLNGKTFRELSEADTVSENTLKTRYYRSLTKLRGHLTSLDPSRPDSR